MAKKRYAMVIDLHRCVGCAACDIACKSENNVPDGFAWSSHQTETTGKFPHVRYRYIPTLCNHCENAPCVAVCPTNAMYKTDEGLTLHNAELCIGCRKCQSSCPYGSIYFNAERPHRRFRQDDPPAVPECTSTGPEVVEKTETPIPYYNQACEATYEGVRRQGIVEKCTFCNHRLALGQLPACVEACPGGARIFGDMNEADSPPRKALAKHRARVLKPEKETKPNVYYIREF